jgi:hypothetical protein
MFSTDLRRQTCRLLPLVALALWILSPPLSAFEIDSADGPEVWLVTYGPGELYWQRFGHNAIWVRDPSLGLDHTFNFGFFDFEQERFFQRFLRGRMLYFSAAQEAGREFDQYVSENRGIRAQQLDLDADQKASLVRFLLQEVRPENRDYLYDYYLNNCSTRVRDVLDTALGGAIRQISDSVPAEGNYRNHTRRLTQKDFWLYLGLESVLGRRVDKPIDRWDEMFIPEVLAEILASEESLVLEDRVLFESTLEPPPVVPEARWPHYLLAALGLLAAAWVACRWLPATLLARAWMIAMGMIGLAILFLWFGTDHRVAALNLNVLVFNPLWLLFAFARPLRSSVQLAAVLFSALALAAAVSPVQYMADVVAAFVPINLAAARVLQSSVD